LEVRAYYIDRVSRWYKTCRLSSANVPPPSPQQLALVSATTPVLATTTPSTSRTGDNQAVVNQTVSKPSTSQISQPASPTSFQRDLNPINFQPATESRRRNAEQRAATLRADPLIGHVEANRVFCSLCQKWVQLRQDSSYCAYPWLQHRGKCLARQYVQTFCTYVASRVCSDNPRFLVNGEHKEHWK